MRMVKWWTASLLPIQSSTKLETSPAESVQNLLPLTLHPHLPLLSGSCLTIATPPCLNCQRTFFQEYSPSHTPAMGLWALWPLSYFQQSLIVPHWHVWLTTKRSPASLFGLRVRMIAAHHNLNYYFFSGTCATNHYLAFSEDGNGVCRPCPANSISTSPESLFCGCVQGYYRNQLEDINVPCTSKTFSFYPFAAPFSSEELGWEGYA